MAMASAKINANIIVIRILGEAEGFRDKPLTAEYPTRAITIDGPNVLISIMNINVTALIVLK